MMEQLVLREQLAHKVQQEMMELLDLKVYKG
jgi:hypothetical protein